MVVSEVVDDSSTAVVSSLLEVSTDSVDVESEDISVCSLGTSDDPSVVLSEVEASFEVVSTEDSVTVASVEL